MPVLVMKFGGTSVASLDKIKSAAERVASEVSAGHSVIVIVSAMAGKTNELVGWVNETSPLYDAREYDAIVSSGENVTAGLMALTLQEMDIPARSWQGWQVPVITTSAHSAARIEEIQTENITSKFNEGPRVAVVAGFQGVSDIGRTTTLGRGGSDTTAVAFAAAFDAIRCDIYTDVDGIYTTDPRITEKAKKLNIGNMQSPKLARAIYYTCEIGDEILKEEKGIIQDLITAAHNNAKSQLKSKTSEELSKATGGFGIPGFKWPL